MKKAKFSLGPTRPNPGPMLPTVARAEVKDVIMSTPDDEDIKVVARSINIYKKKNPDMAYIISFFTGSLLILRVKTPLG